MPTETPYTPLQDLEEELAALDSRFQSEAIDEYEYEPKRAEITAKIYGIHLRNAKNDLAKRYDMEAQHKIINRREYAERMELIRKARTVEQVKEIAESKTPNHESPNL